MMNLVKAHWASHPWLTALELVACAVLASELLLLAHVVLGWACGWVSGDPDAMQSVRFIFMTGEDAKFFAGFLALLVVVPVALLLVVVGGAGAGWAAHTGASVRPFVEAAVCGAALFGLATVLFFATKSFGGGILPH